MGVASGLDIGANLCMKSYWKEPLSRRGVISRSAVRTLEEGLRVDFDIRGGSRNLPVSILSGGNIQKVILARELSQRPAVVIAAYPTRGLDLGAVANVRDILIGQLETGTAVVLVSEDLDELFIMSDRLIVLHAGRIMGEFEPADYDREAVGVLMSGGAAVEGLAMRRLVLEQRATPSRTFSLALPVPCPRRGALILGSIPLVLIGADPIEVYRLMLTSAFGSTRGITDTLTDAMPIMLTGLAAVVTFRMNVWNIGAEGQLQIGAVTSAGVALWLGEGASTVFALVAMIVAGILGREPVRGLGGAAGGDLEGRRGGLDPHDELPVAGVHQLPGVRQATARGATRSRSASPGANSFPTARACRTCRAG